MTTATIDLWKIAMLAANYLGRPKERLMTHTTTEEHELVVRTSNPWPGKGVEDALKLMEAKAAQKCYTYQVADTFEIRIRHGAPGSGVFEIHAKATYAKIVLAPQEAPEAPPIDELSEIN